MRRETTGAPPPGVADRLAALRSLYVPERTREAAERLARERPPATRSFEQAVAARLAELRALSELTRHLHRAQPGSGSGRAAR